MHGQNRDSHTPPRAELLYMWSHCYTFDTCEGRNDQILVEYLGGLNVEFNHRCYVHPLHNGLLMI